MLADQEENEVPKGNSLNIMALKNTILLLILLFLSNTAFSAEDPYFHSVRAQSGDNIYRFLARYKLEKAKCNLEKFYELNGLNSKSKLKTNQKYKIPVLIYTYNGKSIKTTLGISGWEQALKIKKYNEYLKRKNLRQQDIASSKILWVPYDELGCQGGPAKKESPVVIKPPVNLPPPDIPANTPTVDELLTDLQKEAIKESEKTKKERIAKVEQEANLVSENKLEADARVSGYRKFPIFGKKHAYIPQIDNKLRGKVFYIVSGHGGPDSGAVGKSGKYSLYEDEYAYDVALRLVRHLLSHGALAYMITRDPDDGLRDSEILKGDVDEYCWGNYKIPRSQKTRLYQRSDAVNTLYERHKKQGIKDQTLVCIHIDSRSTKEKTDVFFYYFPGSKKGRNLAKKLHTTFKAKYKKYRSKGNYHGTLTGRDLHMLREVKPNSVFIELGNIRNSYDQQRFLKASNREALAKWLYEGLSK